MMIATLNRRCADCTSTSCIGAQCAFRQSDAATSIEVITRTSSDDLIDLWDELKRIARWYESRNWVKAPWAIKSHYQVSGMRILFNRRISPRFWTGRNFRKRVKV